VRVNINVCFSVSISVSVRDYKVRELYLPTPVDPTIEGGAWKLNAAS